MAGITLSGWPSGATVSAYVAPTAVSATPDTDALGSVVTSGAASGAGTVTLTGLVEGQRYIASDGVSRRRFMVPPVGALRALDRDNGQAGMLATPVSGFSASTITLIANRGFLMRFVPSRDLLVTTIAFAVTTLASVDDPVDVGIYDTTGARIVSSGAVTGKLTSTGVKTQAITATALRGGSIYYGSMSLGTLGGTAAALGAASYPSVNLARLFGAALPAVELDVKDAVHPLPVSWGALGGAGAVAPVLAMREA